MPLNLGASGSTTNIPMDPVSEQLVENVKTLGRRRATALNMSGLERIVLESLGKGKVHAEQQTAPFLGSLPLPLSLPLVQLQLSLNPEVENTNCLSPPPTFDAFVIKQWKGKLVRDIWVDTQDLQNEPVGYVINMSRYGEGTDKLQTLRIHLGIRQNRIGPMARPGPPFYGRANSGTLGTDDFAREIFHCIQSHPELQDLHIILEISSRKDSYNQKLSPENSPEILRQFIPTYPGNLTKFQVEMPGISEIYLSDWKFLLDEQTSLKELTCNFGVVTWQFYQNSILKNSKTLRRILLRRLQTFDIFKSGYYPLDWSIFSNCQDLTYLKVTCGHNADMRQRQLSSSFPPSSVFLHENLYKLPRHPTFTELHLGKIWVEQCQFLELCQKRPTLKVCLNCNDVEYYDEDLPQDGFQEDQDYILPTDLRLLQLSQMGMEPETPATSSAEKSERKRKNLQTSPNSAGKSACLPSEGKCKCIIAILFLAMLLALGSVLTITLFRNLKQGSDTVNSYPSPSGVIQTTTMESVTTENLFTEHDGTFDNDNETETFTNWPLSFSDNDD